MRKKNGWSQERMAREIGVSFTTYNGWITDPVKAAKLRETSEKAIKSVLKANGVKS